MQSVWFIRWVLNGIFVQVKKKSLKSFNWFSISNWELDRDRRAIQLSNKTNENLIGSIKLASLFYVIRDNIEFASYATLAVPMTPFKCNSMCTTHKMVRNGTFNRCPMTRLNVNCSSLFFFSRDDDVGKVFSQIILFKVNFFVTFMVFGQFFYVQFKNYQLINGTISSHIYAL